MPSLPPLHETRLTDKEREALAAGWPDFWQVHAAVELIIAEARRKGAADALDAIAVTLGEGPTMRWRDSSGWWDDRPVASWLRDQAAALRGDA